ncbi:MAG: MFS transporter, partial [Acidimicrobiales bacterium]
VVGALILASMVERFGRRRTLVVNLAATPVALVAFANAPNLELATVAVAVVGGLYISILSSLSAVVQLRAPAAFRGRVLSLFFATLSVVFPIGALSQGAIADRVGLPATTAAGAALLVVVVAVVHLARPGLLRAVDDEMPPEPEPGPTAGRVGPAGVGLTGES